ncbi:MAG TPA: cupredoxin domain-containing protein [Candidatus Limnocylindrales bacterium]
MSEHARTVTPPTRTERRRAERRVVKAAEKTEQPTTPSRLRLAAFLVVVAVVLGGGVYLASSVFLGQRGATTVADATPMRISMAGFEPAVLHARPGETLTLDWWNTDGAMHLENGVHTLVSEALDVRLELPAESRRTISLTAPLTPGDYDFWCDSCCGGRDSDTMHGTLRVAA